MIRDKRDDNRTTDKAAVRDFQRSIRDLICDCGELPDRAVDFGDSVEEKACGILERVKSSGSFTRAQERAIENMQGGVDRWIRR